MLPPGTKKALAERKRTLNYDPRYDVRAAENPSVFQEGDDVLIVLRPRVGSLVVAVTVMTLLFSRSL